MVEKYNPDRDREAACEIGAAAAAGGASTAGLVTDMFHYRLAKLESFCGAIVTRLCEGRFGLTRKEWRFVALLNLLGEVSPKDLAAHADVDRGVASRTLAALEEKGLIVRRVAETDSRLHCVRLSDPGFVLYAEMFDALQEVNADVLTGVPPEVREQMTAWLGLLETSARRVLEDVSHSAKADRRRGGSRLHWGRRAGSQPESTLTGWLRP